MTEAEFVDDMPRTPIPAATPREDYVWDESRETQPPHRPLVEIGWVLVGAFDKIDEAAIRTARERTREYLRQVLPQFSWRMPIIMRADPDPTAVHAEPIHLIDLAVVERQSKGWDFVLVFTAADLQALNKQYTFGTPSSGLDAAAISTARLDPAAQRSVVRKSEREAVLSNRIWALFLHLLGDLVGLEHTSRADSPMRVLYVPEDLDLVRGYSDQELAVLANKLTVVADLRLEETIESPLGRWRFTLKVVMRAGGEIWAAVWRNQPWTLVWHLSKFTAAALSTLLLLLFTAEVWDVGVRMPLAGVGFSLLVALGFTTIFVVTRQRLLTRRNHQHLTEQVVVTNLAIVLTIFGAMLTLALLLISLGLGIIWLVPDTLSVRWTGYEALSWQHNLALAGTVTVIGLSIGALGASIEDQTTFRHVAFIDEET
jgi:predicted Zn-dependent protease